VCYTLLIWAPKIFQVSVQEAPSTKDVCLMASGNDVEMKINVLQVIHFTVATWQQVMLSKIVNCFHQCSYEYELNTKVNSDPVLNKKLMTSMRGGFGHMLRRMLTSVLMYL
jgi:hypothetical protein